MRKQRGYTPYAGRKRRLWAKVLAALIALGLLCFVALEVYIGIHSRTNLIGEPQTMVIFGCQVKPWGPSILLQDRLDTALTYWEEHPEIKIIVTGGKGDDEHMSEARCMYNYLTEHGVDGEKIYMEDQARNTWQNVNNTLALMEEQGWSVTEDVLLVSSGFHLSRIEMLWDRGRRARSSDTVYNDQYIAFLAAPVSHTPSAVKMFFREPLALVKSFLFDR